MISRKTIAVFLMAVFLTLGMRAWSLAQKNDCTAIPGATAQDTSQMVSQGSQTVAVPCRDWVPRQPVAIQVLSLLDLVLIVMFLVSLAADVRRWLRMRRGLAA